MSEIPPDEFVTACAQRAYAAYGDVTGGKNYQGNPMPAWDALGETIQDAWHAAVRTVLSSADARARAAD